MNIRAEIDTIFGKQAFARPLFYQYPGGLRFELSEGGSAIDQFLQAHRKATRILADAFRLPNQLIVCLSWYVCSPAFGHRTLIRELRRTGVFIPKSRELWSTPVSEEPGESGDDDGHLCHVAFPISSELMDNLLWIAFATDLGIKPKPPCIVRIFDFGSRLLVFPYDDRGMDIVGPNHSALAALYRDHRQFLLAYDRPIMDRTFQHESGSG